MPVTVFMIVTYQENVGEDRLQLTISVDVPIGLTVTSMSLCNYEHRNQVKNKRQPFPPCRYNAEARTIRIALHLMAALFNPYPANVENRVSS